MAVSERRLQDTHILHFLLWRHVTKCKYTELALNFIQKQYLAKKDHFTFIIVK